MRHIGLLIGTVLLGVGAASGQAPRIVPPFQFRFSEVKYGRTASEHRCVLVFPDKRYHFERANRRWGHDLDRRVFEGEVSEADWNELSAAVDTKDFRELQPADLSSPVVEELHLISISVWRERKFQNMEFVNERSRAPYKAQLKPILQWWKSFSRRTMTLHQAPVSQYCALEGSDNVVFAP